MVSTKSRIFFFPGTGQMTKDKKLISGWICFTKVEQCAYIHIGHFLSVENETRKNMFQKFLLMHFNNILHESAAGATYFCLKLAWSINLVYPKSNRTTEFRFADFFFPLIQTAKNDPLNSTVCQQQGLILTLCPLQIFLLFQHSQATVVSWKVSCHWLQSRLNPLDVSKTGTPPLIPSPSHPHCFQVPPFSNLLHLWALPPALALSHYSQPLHDIPIISLQGIPNPCGVPAVFLG